MCYVKTRPFLNYLYFLLGSSPVKQVKMVICTWLWNESEGTIKQAYSGFRKHSLGVVQFDTTWNTFLATGDEFQINFWDMDNNNILSTIDVEDIS